MKKVLSVVLALVMLFSLTMPAFSVFRGSSDYPIIFIKGNSEDIVDENGNVVYDFDYDTSKLVDDIVEVCMPNLLEGIATGNYSEYYNALYEKFAEVYGNAKLDENGEPLAGTNAAGISENEVTAKQSEKGSYGMHDYHFSYDWRLDPMELADRLNNFINEVIENSKKTKVSLYGRCMGSTPILAYLAKYGSEKIDTVCLDSMVTNGCELIGDVFTGNLNFDTDAIMRFADGYQKDNAVDVIGDNIIFNFIFATVRMLNSVGATDSVIKGFMKTAYGTLGKGVISSLMRAGYATWPSYWTMVKSEDFSKAKNVIFGKEGSELRETYAGLIKKLDVCHEQVTSKVPEILKETKESGTKVCIIAKYGSQLYPYVASYKELSDQWISLNRSTVGATTGKINKPLSKSYIEQQTAAKLERYISLDKQVDASTCALPDNTWIVKGMNHEEWEICNEELAYAVCSNVVKDVNSDPAYPQFLCYDKKTETINPMTEENMNCEDYYSTDTGKSSGTSKDELLVNRLGALFKWIAALFSVFTRWIDSIRKG